MRESAKQQEWEVDMMEKEKLIKYNENILQKKRKEVEIQRRLEKQVEEYAKLELDSQQRDAFRVKTQMGQTPLNTQFALSKQTRNARPIVSKQKKQNVTRNLFLEGEPPMTTHGENDNDLTRQWVEMHSQSTRHPMNAPIEDENIMDLQTRAQKIIEQKQSTRRTRPTLKSKMSKTKTIVDSDKEMEGAPLENKGIGHLKKLGLVPDNFRHRTEQQQRMETGETSQSKSGRTHPLHIDTNFEYNVEDMDREVNKRNDVECGCAANKGKVKSGKYAKSSANLVRQEVWPHTAVSKKYTKRTGFDTLEFDAFVAGESRIIYTRLEGGGRMNKRQWGDYVC